MSMMQEKMYMDVDDVCAILGVSKTYAYSLMREYNKELKAKCYTGQQFPYPEARSFLIYITGEILQQVGNSSTPFLIFLCRKCIDYYPV